MNKELISLIDKKVDYWLKNMILKVTYDKLEDPFPKYKWPVSLGSVINFSSDEVWRIISMIRN